MENRQLIWTPNLAMLNTKVDFTAIWDSAKSSIHGRPSFTWVLSWSGAQ